jgi:hypothetical protein
LRTDYFYRALDGLEGFNGFFPRITIPKTSISQSPDQYEDPKEITALMLIIDSAREVQVGVAPHFPPVTLANNEVMMN